MKVILNLTDEQVKHLDTAHRETGQSYEKLLMDFFYNYGQKPAEIIDELHFNNELEQFYKFGGLLAHYLDESYKDLEEVAKTSEAYDTDKAMLKVMDRLINEHLQDARLMTDLYLEFKKYFKDEL
ncbi:hypothetical protein [Nosocomiicoccus sp. HMSC09A07]|uniref:hypothetical protein n=1 Tax=Nosocomiicoccus sp. HMSC09A07 TaxID=1581145 RepID=UPI0008A341F7|nr:hypothetical protein [Nosocomiicoccus sp. HMSC09A07]OFS61227.1 hypothetical protein HMPREF3177_08300 [Nosocomiicoccus sp. HMSC09A07]